MVSHFPKDFPPPPINNEPTPKVIRKKELTSEKPFDCVINYARVLFIKPI